MADVDRALEKVGKGRIFVSLNVGETVDEVRSARVERAVNELRAEFESKGDRGTARKRSVTS